MYVPDLYARTDTALQHDVIEKNRFGVLTVVVDGQIEAVHLPFVLDPDIGPYGRLRGHIARANPIAAAIGNDGTEVLAVFTGPHAYICPDNYDTQPHFPTWNYIAVQARGSARRLHGDAETRQLHDLIAAQENTLRPKTPWDLSRAPEELVRQYQSAIVAFQIEVTSLKSIFKLGQNKNPVDVRAQAESFRSRGTPEGELFAALLEEHNASRFAADPGRPEAADQDREPGADDSAERSTVRDRIAALWRELFGDPDLRIAGEDDFFMLGASSVLAMILVTRLREQFGRPVDLLDVMENPTLEGMAGVVWGDGSRPVLEHGEL